MITTPIISVLCLFPRRRYAFLRIAYLLLPDRHPHFLVQLYRRFPGARLLRRRPQPNHNDSLHQERQLPPRAEGSLVQERPGGVEARKVGLDILVDLGRPQVGTVDRRLAAGCGFRLRLIGAAAAAVVVLALQASLQAKVARRGPFAFGLACFAVHAGCECAEALQILVSVVQLDVAAERVSVAGGVSCQRVAPERFSDLLPRPGIVTPASILAFAMRTRELGGGHAVGLAEQGYLGSSREK